MFGFRKRSLVTALVVSLIALITVQATDLRLNSQCQRLSSCGACIGALSGKCAWCADLNYTTGEQFSVRPRCQLFQVIQASGCVNVVNPQSSAAPAANTQQTGSNQLVSPQQYNVVLRPGQPVELGIEVFRSDKYPVDLYYLMDLTLSMTSHLNVVKNLSRSIDQWMRLLTDDYQLGFGSFIDKPRLPFVNLYDFASYCPQCKEWPYGFISWRSLTSNITAFQADIERRVTTRSLDAPEAGLDALFQVAVCTKEIGWRKNAHHLVVMVTDASSHIAGDGKLGGIYRPHDGKCHLAKRSEGTMEYDYTLEQDYPSPGHLATAMREHEILPIFAVMDIYAPVYKDMVEAHLKDVRGQVGILQRDSSNMKDVIASSYYSIVSSASLEVDASQVPSELRWEFSTVDCPGPIVDNSCTNLTFNQKARLKMTLSLSACSASAREKLKNGLMVRVPAFGTVHINTTLLCDCECEKKPVSNAPFCSSGKGSLTCGACVCNSGRFGPKCQCVQDDPSPEEAVCGAGPISDGRCCDTAADCSCGGLCQKDDLGEKTTCNSTAAGVCIPKQCPKGSNGLECSGRGWCVCGKCTCPTGYTGQSCSDLCPIKTDNCQSALASGLCNRRGSCTCGLCECDHSYVSHKEKLCVCDVTNTTSSCLPTCSMVESSCAFCQLYNNGPKAGQLCASCTQGGAVRYVAYNEGDRTLQMTQMSSEHNNSLTWSRQQCTGDIEVDECELKYFVAADDRGDLRVVLARQECPSSANTTQVIIGIVVGIIAVGILILILWKVVSTFEMKREQEREYKAFQRELAMGALNQVTSPLYESPEVKYENPVYRRRGEEGSSLTQAETGNSSTSLGMASHTTSMSSLNRPQRRTSIDSSQVPGVTS